MNILLDLDMTYSGIPKVVKLSQYDDSIPVLQITLWEGSTNFAIPSGATVQIQGTKPDHKGFAYECTYDGSVVTAEVTQQMTAVAGMVECELVVFVGEERKGSQNFKLQIEAAGLASDTDISETELPAIIDMGESVIEQAVADGLVEIDSHVEVAQGYADEAHDYADEAQQRVEDAIQDVEYPTTFTNTEESFALPNTKEGSALIHKAYGMSVQDGTPTPSSPVEIKSAKADYRCVGKNLNSYPYNQTTKTQNGIAFTDNGDGTITANGTATNDTYFACHSRLVTEANGLVVPNGTYIFSGCPAGGNDTVGGTYAIRLERTYNGASNRLGTDIGNGATITLNGDDYFDDKVQFQISIIIRKSATVNNVTFKPMLTLADVEDQTYEPYKSTDITTDLTLRAIEVSSTDDYNLIKDGKYYIADTLDWSEDRGYEVTRRIGHDAITTAIFYQDKGNNVAQFNVAIARKSKYSAKLKSNRFIPDTTLPREDGECYIDNASATNVFVGFVEDSSITSVATATTWLSSHATYVDYILATPTTEPITSEQAQALLSMKTYDFATSIDATGDVSPMTQLEYTKGRVAALALQSHNEAYVAQELEGLYGVKNLLPYPYYLTSKTENGLTFVDNGDGSVTINGTCTGQTFFQFWGGRINLITTDFLNEKEDYVVTLDVDGDINLSSGDCVLCFRTYPQNSPSPFHDVFYITKITDSIREQFTFTHPDGYIYSILWLEFRTGTVLNNVTVKPMFRLASIQSDEYQPYAMTNYELTKKIKELETALLELGGN